MTDPARGARARGSQTATKDVLRSRLRARRTAVPLPAGDRTARALALSAAAPAVACYVSLPEEPDTHSLIETLAAGGTRILLPVLRREPDWAWYTGPDDLTPGWRGIPEPTSDRLGPEALAQAAWIWVPGLAGTPAGDRLGTGGGWYDRALGHASADTRIGLLLHDGELLDALPTDPWDRRVDVILTASATVWRAE
ncbi:MAG: 5-formyltetrahydrofolate cyclo-ligase [Propionicimonas sp.]|nr:5-formyltetrahydrofolate cyclo-ligase [Propionicimonas sp.]